MLTSMSVGSVWGVSESQSVEGYVVPPEESSNGTTRYEYLSNIASVNVGIIILL